MTASYIASKGSVSSTYNMYDIPGKRLKYTRITRLLLSYTNRLCEWSVKTM